MMNGKRGKCERARRDAHEIERWEPRRRAHEYQAAANPPLVTIARRRQPESTLHALARNQADTSAGVVHPDLAEHLTAGSGDD